MRRAFTDKNLDRLFVVPAPISLPGVPAMKIDGVNV
jgi:hypothetical protein